MHAEGLVSASQAKLVAAPELVPGAVDLSPTPINSSSAFNSPAQTPGPRIEPAQAHVAQTPQAESLPLQAQFVPLQLEQGTLLRWIGDWATGLSLASLGELAAFLYFAVCGVLLARTAYGLNRAIDLWFRAEVFVPYPEDDPGFGLHMRFSRAVSSPVTIGSGRVFPYECLEWDAEKLRIVLAHERAHIR